jgi:hypothetical protein
MMRKFRISLICGLVLTLLLVKNHLDSIKSDRQDRRGFDYVVDDTGGAHIELVSKDQFAAPIHSSLQVSSSTTTPVTPTPTPTSKVYPEPTKPAIERTEFKPEIIPVEVPGLWDSDDDDFASFLWGYMEEGEEEEGERKPTPSSPPKPKVTPKSDRIIVVGRTSRENTDWLEEELPE